MFGLKRVFHSICNVVEQLKKCNVKALFQKDTYKEPYYCSQCDRNTSSQHRHGKRSSSSSSRRRRRQRRYRRRRLRLLDFKPKPKELSSEALIQRIKERDTHGLNLRRLFIVDQLWRESMDQKEMFQKMWDKRRESTRE